MDDRARPLEAVCNKASLFTSSLKGKYRAAPLGKRNTKVPFPSLKGRLRASTMLEITQNPQVRALRDARRTLSYLPHLKVPLCLTKCKMSHTGSVVPVGEDGRLRREYQAGHKECTGSEFI